MDNISNKLDLNIFTDKFKLISTDIIIDDLKKFGYFSYEKALTDQVINEIEKDATKSKINLNNNKITGVYSEKQYYFTNLLASSKKFYNFVTSDFVFNISEKFLGKEFRLKALRYYETLGGHHMQWHSDNKTDKQFAQIPGLIFIFYISDVADGEFQYIQGSHIWSGKSEYSDYNDQLIEKNYKDKIKSFKLQKGSLIIYNSYGIHRAKPVKNKKFIRKSVFFQVDAKTDNSEPIIINTEYIEKVDKRLSMFLGFGKPSNYNVFPSTSLNTLQFNKNFFITITKYFIYRFLKNILNFLPLSIKKKLRDKIKIF